MNNGFKTIFEIENSNLTKVFKEYLKTKLENQDYVVFYRIGEFYEAYFEDAKIVSKICQITLTKKKTKENIIPSAGIPKNSCLIHINKLLDNNFKIAICEEIKVGEEITRKVSRKYTQGTLLEDEFLISDKNNFIGSVFIKGQEAGFSYSDISTGEFFVTQSSLNNIEAEISKINPRELIIPLEENSNKEYEKIADNINVSFVDKSYWQNEKKGKYELGCMCANSILKYTHDAKKELTPLLTYQIYDVNHFLFMNKTTRKALELVENMTDNKKFGSLFWALDEAKTPMGKRLLEKYINEPICNIEEITKRQNAILEIIENRKLIEEIDNLLDGISDLIRNSIKISNSTTNKKTFYEIKKSLTALSKLDEILKNFTSPIINFNNNSTFEELLSLIEKNISDDFENDEIIKNGANNELDYLREQISEIENKINNLQNVYIEKTGIKNLKIVNNKTMGYLVEAPASKQKELGEDFIIRQVLSTSVKCQTKELIEFEKTLQTSMSKAQKLEVEIFKSIQNYSKEFFKELREISEKIAKFDVMLSFAKCAIKYNFIKPQNSENKNLEIEAGAHFALLKKTGKFDKNDIKFNKENPNFKLLTGPNMAGKSTLMRELAHIIIMNQIGSFVPCKSATLPILNKIFVRFGINDNIIKNNSSFMVEMLEAKEILDFADENSLILIDELGKSTSTKDGIAISRAISEYIIENIKAKTIFATHYHELRVLKDNFKDNVGLICVQFKNKNDGIIRELSNGFINKSYGIEVAKAVRLPDVVIKKAENYLS